MKDTTQILLRILLRTVVCYLFLGAIHLTVFGLNVSTPIDELAMRMIWSLGISTLIEFLNCLDK